VANPNDRWPLRGWLSGRAIGIYGGFEMLRPARVQAVCERYQALVGEFVPRLTEAEWWLLLRLAWRGRLLEPEEARTLWARVDALVRDRNLVALEGVDGPALVSKLRRMGSWEQLAVADVLERLGLMDENEASRMSRAEQIARAGGLVEGQQLDPEDPRAVYKVEEPPRWQAAAAIGRTV
jgi:hypothetical protein